MVMRSSELRVWLAASSVSIIVHIAIIGYYDPYEKMLIESQYKALLSIVHLTLVQVAPKPEHINPDNNNPEPKQSKTRNAEPKRPELKQPEPPIPEVNKPEPKQPEPPIPEVNKPEPKQPEPTIPEVNKPKPKQPEPPIPEVNKLESKQPEPVSEESLQRAVMSPASIPAQVSDNLRKEYLRSLMTHIEAHKYYPRRARNRDIEGVVEISFDLLENGDVTNIRTSGGHRLLRAAAEHAIQQSLPLQIPPPFLQLPREIHFSMRFDLD